MERGGKREGAGRKKGIPNKATIKRQEEIAGTGITPLDYMIAVLRDEMADKKRRDWAAQAAAPYVHPKLASTELTGKDGGPIETITDPRDVARAVAELLREAALEKEQSK